MSFRYADGTPFPLDSNFLATTTRLVNVCADLVANDLVDVGWDADADARAPVLSLLERALPLAELPETDVSMRFSAGHRDGDGSIVVTERTYFGLEIEAAVEIDRETVFCGPFRVAEVARDVHATLPERRWFGRAPARKCLDRYVVVGATVVDDAGTLTLARRPGKPVIEIDVRAGVYTTEDGAHHAMSDDDVQVLTGVWQRVARGMFNRADRVGRRLITGRLGGESLARLGDARPLASRLIDAIAPLFAEVLYRGDRSDALVLYENDNVYLVPLRELQRVVERLPAGAREPFVPLGLAAPKPDSGVSPLPLAAVSAM